MSLQVSVHVMYVYYIYYRCSHGISCTRVCGTSCVFHQDRRPCTWGCEHDKCSKTCGEPCDHVPCDKQCDKMVKCVKKGCKEVSECILYTIQ